MLFSFAFLLSSIFVTAQAATLPFELSALEEPSESATAVFQKAFFDPEIYQIADCSSNVWRLLGLLDSKGIDLGRAKVLYIFQTESPESPLSEEALERLHPLRAKLGIGPYTIPWIFHVNLVYDETVFDLDYQHWPHPEPLNTYFATMFSEKERAGLFMRVIPATDYLKEYLPGDGPRNWKYFLFDPDRRYPLKHAL